MKIAPHPENAPKPRANQGTSSSAANSTREECSSARTTWDRLCVPKTEKYEKLRQQLREEKVKRAIEARREKQRQAQVVQRVGGPDPKHTAFLQLLVDKRQEEERAKSESIRKANLRKEFLAIKVRKRAEEVKLSQHQANSLEEEDKEESEKQKGSQKKDKDAGWLRNLNPVRLSKEANRQVEAGMDRSRWARRRGISETTPVFICSKGYPAIRDELKRRGWYENKDRASLFWDLCFVMKINKIPHRANLRDGQIVNRFLSTGVLCSKLGLLNNLKNIKWHDNLDHDDFFPRSYNLSTAEGDLSAFVDDFKLTAAEAVLRQFKAACTREGNIRAPIFLLEVAMKVCNRFVQAARNEDLDVPTEERHPVCTDLEWFFINQHTSFDSPVCPPPEKLLMIKRKGTTRGERLLKKVERNNFRRAVNKCLLEPRQVVF